MLFNNKPKEDDHIIDKLIDKIELMKSANANKSTRCMAFYIDDLLVSISDGVFTNVSVNDEKLSVSRKKRQEFYETAMNVFDEQQIEKRKKRREKIYQTLNIK